MAVVDADILGGVVEGHGEGVWIAADYVQLAERSVKVRKLPCEEALGFIERG